MQIGDIGIFISPRNFYLGFGFDGGITLSRGRLIDCKRVMFQEDRFGCHVLSPLFADYGKKECTSTVCNGYDGFLFCIEGDENTAIAIETVSATAKFTIGELLKNEHLVFDTENPFLFGVMHVYLKEHEWYLAKRQANEIRLKGSAFNGKQNSFFGVNGVVVPCGERVKSSFDFYAEEKEGEEVKVEGAIRVIQSQSAVRDEPIGGVVDYEIVINGESVYKNSRYSCNWDDHSENFEETVFSVQLALLKKSGNVVEIINHDEQRVVLVQMVRFFVKNIEHLQILSCPKWLAIYLPWVFGANFVYEEDSLFQNNKYYRMVNDDYMTLEKQKVAAEFYKHIQTHSRIGQPRVDIAFIQGRHEAPFTALSTCNAPMERLYESEDRRIWGKNGGSEEEWGHRRPEKGLLLLEVVAPQIYLPPLNQDPYKTRKLFSANPYGKWDFLPIEAPQEIYAQYKILFMLGWNTMAKRTEGVGDCLENDYQRLKSYAEQGGVVVLSVPQLSQRVDRKLFKDWDNAELYNDGNVQDLFGVRIGKPCEEFSGCVETVDFPIKDYTEKRELIRRPAKSEEEDGVCLLASVTLDGAEICLIDKKNNRPILVRKKVGRGYAYLLCVYAYPGHEQLKYISVNIMQSLLDMYAKKDIFVKDPSNAVYWSDWRNGNVGKLYLVNTDWTAIGNKKSVEVVKGDLVFDCTVKERKLLEIAYQAESAVYATTEQVNVVANAENENLYELYGFGSFDLHILSSQNTRVYLDGEEIAQTRRMETVIRVSLSGKSTLYLSENVN